MQNRQHAVPVPGIGEFVFRHKTFKDAGLIGGQYYDFTGGVSAPEGSWLDLVATAYATLKVLTIKAPDGWSLDAMDPENPDDYRKLVEVLGALRAAEGRFRGGSGVAGQAGSQGTGRDGGSVVPPEVQPHPV